MIILPLTYLGNTEYFSRLLSGGCVIDMGENYVKQTYRNRCDIATANGSTWLTVKVVKGGSMHKKAVRDIRIDYSKRWQHQHSRALVSAYRNSPYFDHYRDRFAPFYEKRFDFLADFNIGLLEVCLAILGDTPMPRISEHYIVAAPGDTDLRNAFTPGRRGAASAVPDSGTIPCAAPDFHTKSPADTAGHNRISHTGLPRDAGGEGPLEFREQSPYWQVFSDRYPFIPNLSVVDLIFCEGPAARGFLSR